YLYAICRNLWLKRLRHNRIAPLADIELLDGIAEQATVVTKHQKTIEEKLASWMLNITHNCRNVLKALFFYNESMDSLMKRMGWKNKHTAANMQYKCIQQVKREKNRQEVSA